MDELTPQEQQRAQRRRHKHERQAVIFGTLITALAVTCLLAAAIYTGAMSAPFLTDSFTTASPEGQDAIAPPPCPPAGTLPVGYGAIPVRVLNSTGRAGLAATTSTELTTRGFVVASTSNFPATVTGTAVIQFGQAGLASAYTLSANIADATLILDTRQDAGVDLVLGDTWPGLLDATLVSLDPAAPLVGVPGCVALEEALLDAGPGPTATPAATETPAAEGAAAPAG